MWTSACVCSDLLPHLPNAASSVEKCAIRWNALGAPDPAMPLHEYPPTWHSCTAACCGHCLQLRERQHGRTGDGSCITSSILSDVYAEVVA